MSVYWNWRNEDRKQAEVEAAELFDRHERAWHVDAIERVYADHDKAIDAMLDHEMDCNEWAISLMGKDAYEAWCQWNWREELGRVFESWETPRWSACAAASNQPTEVDPQYNVELSRLIAAGRFNK